MINSWLGKYLRYFPTAGAIAAVPYVFIKGLKMNKRTENVIASSDHKFKNFGRSETFKDLTSDYIIETIDKIFELYLNN